MRVSVSNWSTNAWMTSFVDLDLGRPTGSSTPAWATPAPPRCPTQDVVDRGTWRLDQGRDLQAEWVCLRTDERRRPLVQHANARLTVHARRLLDQRVEAGWPQARVAEQLGVARQTVSRWWPRYQAGGDAALRDQPRTPRRCPGRTPGAGRAGGDRRTLPAPGGTDRARGDARRSMWPSAS